MDATSRPLRVPREMGIYAEKHELFQLLQNMLEGLLIHKPDEPIQYMISHLKQDNDHVPRICILGPPASGKTTIATWLCKQLNTPCITQETLLEETLELTKEVTAFQERGQKIPNALWANLIQERLSNVDCIKQGWILEGFPENRDQAWMLQLAGITPRHVVVLYAPDTVLIERNLGKRIDPSTKEVYHTTFDWPSDPLVQQRLVEAEGISEQETAKHLLEYHRNFPRVFQIYQQILKLINADQPCADVFSQALTYVQTWCRSAAPFTPRILFCGPPGSGKSLQAALIAQKYSIVNICCGQLLKEAVADKTKLGELIKPYFDSRWPVPDNIILKLLTDRLNRLDCMTDGWVLHGFPRDLDQAEQMVKAGIIPNRCPSLPAALGLVPSLLSTIISLVRLMEEIVSNYPVEGPIMLLTFVGYKLMMKRASHLHSIKTWDKFFNHTRQTGRDGDIKLSVVIILKTMYAVVVH
ncbi:adenylate kinase 8 isoform X2 [Lepidochelys kempii]|uniref:adenylate kinase 8 isoform X2 n=1 Tax=Lepidochelys kempii TaxID=8472 RepID=UPI003C6EC716